MGGFKHSREALWGESFGWVPSQIDLSDPPTRNSLRSSQVRSQGQVLPQSWWLFFLAWEASRSGLIQTSAPASISRGSWSSTAHIPASCLSQHHREESRKIPACQVHWSQMTRVQAGLQSPGIADRGSDPIHQAGLSPWGLSTWGNPAVVGRIPKMSLQDSIP